MSATGELRARSGQDGIRLARWMAVCRWLLDDGAPTEITAAVGKMVYATRNKLRGLPTGLPNGGQGKRIREVARDALDAWWASGKPGLQAATGRALRLIKDERLPAHT